MKRWLMVVLFSLAACAVRGDATEDAGDTADTNATSDGAEDTGTGDGDPIPDSPAELEMCDFWAEDACPPGQKCQAVASTPGVGQWDGTICLPFGEDSVWETCCLAGHGDCWMDGPEGTDSCDATSTCRHVDASSLRGLCIEYCVGPMLETSCPQTNGVCTPPYGGSPYAICSSECDPLSASPCAAGEVCAPWSHPAGHLIGFKCEPAGTTELGGPGEPCDCPTCCSTGLTCVDQQTFGAGCPADACCTRLCDVEDPELGCEDPGQACASLFDPNDPTYENLGQCQVPPAP